MKEYTAVWEYLKDTPMREHHFPRKIFAHLWGDWVHKMAIRFLKQKIHGSHEFLDSLFPDLQILDVHPYRPRKNGMVKAKNGKLIGIDIRCDLLLTIDCKASEEIFLKKCIMFEVKVGISPITRTQLNYYKKVIENPAKFVKKVDAIRVFYMWVNGVDQIRNVMFYHMKELKLDELPTKHIVNGKEN